MANEDHEEIFLQDMIETREIIDLMERVERINNPYADYCQHHLTSLSAGEWNDSFVREFESKSPINEAIFRTYSAEKAISYVKNLFGLNDRNIRKETGAGDNPHTCRIVVNILNNERDIEAMDTAMNLCGYVRSRDIPDGEYITMSYVSRHEEKDITREVHRMGQLFHITPHYNTAKIKRIGFVPRSSNSRFGYPDRIYFFRGDTPPVELGFQILDFCDNNPTKGDKSQYDILWIDTDKIPEDCRFFFDPNYSMGIFTTDNIPSSAISNVQGINVEKLRQMYRKNGLYEGTVDFSDAFSFLDLNF